MVFKTFIAGSTIKVEHYFINHCFFSQISTFFISRHYSKIAKLINQNESDVTIITYGDLYMCQPYSNASN